MLLMQCPYTRRLVLISPTSEGWQAESTPLGVNSMPDRGSNSGPEDPKPATLTTKPVPSLPESHVHLRLINCNDHFKAVSTFLLSARLHKLFVTSIAWAADLFCRYPAAAELMTISGRDVGTIHSGSLKCVVPGFIGPAVQVFQVRRLLCESNVTTPGVCEDRGAND